MMLLLRKNTATHPSAEIKEQEGTKHIAKEDEDEDEKEEDEDKDDTGDEDEDEDSDEGDEEASCGAAIESIIWSIFTVKVIDYRFRFLLSL